jgi:polysaccharide chain length determinant protein (PEP-CTERM system associated)
VNTHLIEWSPDHRPSAIQLVPVVVKEFRRRYLLLAAIFAAVALMTLIVGLRTPKAFTSSTTLLVEETNIIEPLLKGRTVTTNIVDQAGIAREVAFSRRVMGQILQAGGWMDSHPSAIEQDRLIDDITSRTAITNPRDNLKLIQISYTDTDPERAFRVTKRFAELIVLESLRTKERESRAAFQFIDSQVSEYHRSLSQAEAKLVQYRRAHPDSLLGTVEEISQRIADLRREIDKSQMDLADESTQAGAWQSHLSRESSVGVTQARSSQVRARLVELEAERDKLTGIYTDQHPDVIRVQHQIRDLEAQLRNGTAQRSVVTRSSADAALDPMYGDVRNRLTEARSRSAAAASRVREGKALLAQELAALNRLATSGSELANLTRNFEVNRNLYQDLLERRENARLSMNLDAQRAGLNFRIQEPAAVPLRSNGMSLRHVAMAGLLLAIAIPLLFLVSWVRYDPRVRSPAQIEHLSGLPVLGSIPARATPRQEPRSRQRVFLAAALLASVPIAYAVVLTLR